MIAQPVGVSFLVCTYNGAARIAETLACLAHQVTSTPIAWEVIVVDNASTDGTSEVAKRSWEQVGAPASLRVFSEPRPGKNFAVEVAFSKAQYLYACIVDDDNRLAPDYLQIGFDQMQANPAIGMLGGRNKATFEGNPPSWFNAFQHCYAVGEQIDYVGGSFLPLTEGNIGRNVLWGAGMFVRTDLWRKLEKVGFASLFSGRQGTKNLTAGEDDELCYVAQLLGYEVWYSSKLYLQHHMTAGRLTPAYRDKLFYASVWSAGRLGAYRNALWGRVKSKDTLTINLIKDFIYMSLGFLKHVLSIKYIKALFNGDKLYIKYGWHQLLTLYDFVRNFSRIKEYYRSVLDLKYKIQGTA
jgi:glycosyltransferase involved in cell wall biosynthesis